MRYRRKGESQLKEFSATLQRGPSKGGWTYVVLPESARFFDPRGLVEFCGTMDGQPSHSSFEALGDGTHKLPVNAELRKAIGKDAGDAVRVSIEGRLDGRQA
jgi:hypothetical protein